MHKQLDTLMQREMTRKEFMATLGLGVVTMFGFGSVIKYIKPSFGTTTTTTAPNQPRVSNTYGSSAYGG